MATKQFGIETYGLEEHILIQCCILQSIWNIRKKFLKAIVEMVEKRS